MDQSKDEISTVSTGEKENVYNVDYRVVMKEIGALGKYQILLVAMAYWVTIPAGFNQVASVFLAAVPDFRCALPPLDSSPTFANLTEEELRNYTLPIDPRTGEPDQCKRYDYNLTACTSMELNCISPYPPVAPDVTIINCDKGYYYDQSIYISTITTEWNLVCDDQLLGTIVQAIFFAGILISSIVGGNVADIFGRCPTMLVGQVGMMAIGIGCAFSPNLATFTALRFGLALFLQAGYIACFVYLMEITGEKWRTFIGINVQAVFAIGYMTLSGFAYAWRDWRTLQFAISFVPLPFILFYFFLPESPMWLFSKGKVEKGKKISEQLATRNGNSLSKDVWERAEEQAEKNEDSAKIQNYSPFELFKRKKMCLITINMMFNWFVNSLVYYGLSLNVGELAGDPYLNNMLNGLVEFGAYFFIILTMDRLGRKPLLSGCLLFGGVCCLVSIVAAQYADTSSSIQNTSTAFALMGKMAVSGSFAIIYNFTAELYPTVVRSTAVGLGSMAARCGSIITPFTLQLQYIIPWLTSTLFGVLAIVAGLATFAFPETNGRNMLTSLDEAENFYAGKEDLDGSESSSCHQNEAYNKTEDGNLTQM